MAVFLAVFDNQYAKEKQEMLDTIFYKQVTDSKNHRCNSDSNR